MTALADCVSVAITMLARCWIALVRALITSRRKQSMSREHSWSEYLSRTDMMKIRRSNELSRTTRARLGCACTSGGTFLGTFPMIGEGLASSGLFSSSGRGQSNRIALRMMLRRAHKYDLSLNTEVLLTESSNPERKHCSAFCRSAVNRRDSRYRLF